MAIRFNTPFVMETISYILCLLGALFLFVISPLVGWDIRTLIVGVLAIYSGGKLSSYDWGGLNKPIQSMTDIVTKEMTTTQHQQQQIDAWGEVEFCAAKLLGTYVVKNSTYEVKLVIEERYYTLEFKNLLNKTSLTYGKNFYRVKGQTISFSTNIVREGFFQTPLPFTLSKETLTIKTKSGDVLLRKSC